MKEQLNELKKAMAELEYQQSYYKSKKELFDADMADTTEIIKATKEQIEKIKQEINPLAVAEYESTGEKKLIGGLGIRCVKTLEYDEAKAFEFAKQKQMFLQLDKKSFEKVAVSLGLDFVKQGEKITVTFPKEIGEVD
jgi:hypothetical protein